MSDLKRAAEDAAQRAKAAAVEVALADDATRKKTLKRWAAWGGVGLGVVGLVFLYSIVSKIGFYLMVLFFGALVAGGGYYLARGKYRAWAQRRLTAQATKDAEQDALSAAQAEIDHAKALQAQLDELKRKRDG